jgi:hypothetical protein
VTAIDLNGRRIGRPALRIYQGQQGRVTVRNGHSALVPLQVFEARLLYPRPRCRPVTAAGLRVYPPGQNRSRVVPFPLVVCSSRRIVSMNVSPVMPGR